MRKFTYMQYKYLKLRNVSLFNTINTSIIFYGYILIYFKYNTVLAFSTYAGLDLSISRVFFRRTLIGLNFLIFSRFVFVSEMAHFIR